MGIKIGKYKHFKGNTYCVAGIVKDSETLEDMVLYFNVDDPEKVWVRPASMWNDDINGVPRFKYIGD